ncbi:metalloprotease PmbA [Rickettsiella grylli]|uniref:TldD/PmbA family protein n=1 Tax=Rickettsiella grylli TaxID=59196 RepID=A8PKR8_9COXI|nr:metalloprotease PmbA [Rickettsiella grylli]EDP46545.1 TldD/PmbA family protein [Rickettsiella grylli]
MQTQLKHEHPLELINKQADYKNQLIELMSRAKKRGVTQVEAHIHHDTGFSISIRNQDVETIEHNRNKSLGVTVYFGYKKGSASTSDFSSQAIENTVEAACHIARFTTEDPFNGLAESHFLEKNPLDLDLYHPWSIDPQHAIALGKTCEAKAMAIDNRLTSENVVLSTQEAIHVYGNSNGFLAGYPSSLHTISCHLIAKDKMGMQRDGSYTLSRDPNQLQSFEKLAEEAANTTLKRLNARRLSTCHAPILFHSEIANHVISAFLNAISGGNLYRKASFLVDYLGKSVFDKKISIYEKPHLLNALGSTPFDDEGVCTSDRVLVNEGILQGYLLNSYSARKLGLQTTGNAGGFHNILLKTSQFELNDLIKQMGKGLLVTEVMGQGINLVTGDYSRGAAGYWVENGEIQYPVEEVTIAGNLKDMFQNIIAIGNDINYKSSIQTGSIFIENMMIAGTL